jgi:hypothetical protein
LSVPPPLTHVLKSCVYICTLNLAINQVVAELHLGATAMERAVFAVVPMARGRAIRLSTRLSLTLFAHFEVPLARIYQPCFT